MTRVCGYARFSTDLQNDKSNADQQRAYRAFAASQPNGWTVTHDFDDAAFSGASMIGRRGLQALLRAARAGEFDVVVAESLSRLSRSQADLPAIYERLKFARVRLVTLAEGEIDEMKIGFKGTMNAIALDDLKQMTRRGLGSCVAKGRSAGGNCYGYRVVPGLKGDRGKRQIVPAEAAIVLRIYRDFVANISPKAIAKALNAAGIAGPRGRAWSPSTIHGHSSRGTGILNNELYIGRRVWDRQQYRKNPDTDKRVARPNPQSTWTIKEVPELRIIDDALWQAAKARQVSTRYRMTAGIVGARRPKYLFSGLTTCGSCGGGFHLSSHDRLTCFNAHSRGTCSNRRSIKRQEVEVRVLRAMRERLFEPGAFAAFCEGFTAEMTRLRREHIAHLAGARRELETVKRRQKEILNALAEGYRSEAWKAELVTLDARKAELTIATVEPPQPALHPRLAEVFRQKTMTLAAGLEHDEQRDAARQALRGFLEKIVIPPGDGLLQVVGNFGAMLAAAEGRCASATSAVGYVGCGGVQPPVLAAVERRGVIATVLL